MTERSNPKEHWQQLRDGNSDALSALYQFHYVGLINYGIKLTGDADLSNDCITAVLLELWEKRNSLPVVNNVRAYLCTCLHHRILLEIKNDKKRDDSHKAALVTQAVNELPHDTYLIRGEDARQFNQEFTIAFSKLTQRQQQLLRMKFFEDHDYDSIAVSCGITKRTVYNIIHDALKQLKHALKGTKSLKDLPVSEAFQLLSLMLVLQYLKDI